MAGIGTGGSEFPSQLDLQIRQPLAVVRESVEIVRALLVGDARLQGKVFSAIGASLGWQPGSMPVYLAARGPKMLELSGEIADGVITHGLAPSHLDFALARIKAGAAAANRPGKGSDLVLMFDFELDEDRDAALQRLRKRCMFMVGGSYAEELIPLYGLDPEQVRPIRAAVSRGEFQTAVDLITPKMVEAFAVSGRRTSFARHARVARFPRRGRRHPQSGRAVSGGSSGQNRAGRTSTGPMMDLRIAGATVITLDADQKIIDADVYVRDGRFAAIGGPALAARYHSRCPRDGGDTRPAQPPRSSPRPHPGDQDRGGPPDRCVSENHVEARVSTWDLPNIGSVPPWEPPASSRPG